MSLFSLPTYPQMKCVVGAPAASVVDVKIVCDVFLRAHSYTSWISQYSRMCQEYVRYLFQGLPQSGVILKGYLRQHIATFHYLMEWKWEHLKKTPNRHITFRSMNPGQQFDAGIKYVWSSRNNNKNVSLLLRIFFTVRRLVLSSLCVISAFISSFFHHYHHCLGLTSSRWCLSNIGPFPAVLCLEWRNKPFPLLNRFQISQRFLGDGYCPS